MVVKDPDESLTLVNEVLKALKNGKVEQEHRNKFYNSAFKQKGYESLWEYCSTWVTCTAITNSNIRHKKSSSKWN